MGAYLSLHGPEEWNKQVFHNTWEPSIWANVPYSPLARDRKLLLERGGGVRYIFPETMRYQDDVVRLAPGAEASIIAGFDDATGKVYAGLMLHAPESLMHTYCRFHDEFILQRPGGTKKVTPMTEKENSAGPFSPSNAPQRSKQENSETLAMSSYGNEDLPSPLMETQWAYALFYVVREGILIYFSNEPEECYDVIRSVAAYGDYPDPSKAKLKCVSYYLGGTLTSRRLVETLHADLHRRFAIHCKPSEQAQTTNCVVFCMRSMMSLQLAIRGYDVRRTCVERPDIGPVVGEAAALAWEQVWKYVRD